MSGKASVNQRGHRSAGVAAVAAAFVAFTMTPADANEVTLVALGDSLTAGYDLAPENAFPVRLEAALNRAGHDVTIVNAGVSGDTTAGGLARLDWSVGREVDGVIVELGANDALRGLSPAQTLENLDALLARLSDRGMPVLLAGMLAPRNLGADYAKAFDAIYPRLARKYDVVFYPFFLEGVATDPALNLGDGMHPNEHGIDVIVDRILPSVEKLLAAIAANGDADG